MQKRSKTTRWGLYGLLIVLAVAIGGIYSSFHLFCLHDRGWTYDGTLVFSIFTQARDNDYYVALLREVYEGNYALSNPYLSEYKNGDVPPLMTFPVYAVGFLGKALPIDLQTFIILIDFLVPALIFGAAYLMFMALLNSPRPSILGAFMLVMTPQLLFLPQLWQYLKELPLRLYGIIPSVLVTAHGSFGTFGRTLHPKFAYVFLLLALYWFFLALMKRSIRHTVFSIVAGSIVSYTYVYTSTYLYTVLGSCFLIALALRERWYIRISLITLGSILAASLPFWLNVFFTQSAGHHRMTWGELQRGPTLTSDVLLLLACVAISLLLWRRKIISNRIMMVCTALPASSFICMNQQVITGIVVEPWHYQLYIVPESLLMTGILLGTSLVRWKSTRHGKGRAPIRHSLPLPRLLILASLVLGVTGIMIHPALLKLFAALVTESPLELSEGAASFFRRVYHGSLVLSGICLLLGLALEKWSPRFVPRRIRLGTLGIVLWICFTMSDVSLARYAYYVNILSPNFSPLQRLAPALDWLDQNTPSESVVFGMTGKKSFFPQPEYVSTTDLISIYTDNNVYMSENTYYHAEPPMTELQDRTYVMMYFMGIRTIHDFQQFMSRRYIRGTFEDYQQKFGHDVYRELTQYRIDYVWYGPRERRYVTVHPDAYDFLTKVYDDQIVQIYQVVQGELP